MILYRRKVSHIKQNRKKYFRPGKQTVLNKVEDPISGADPGY